MKVVFENNFQLGIEVELTALTIERSAVTFGFNKITITFWTRDNSGR